VLYQKSLEIVNHTPIFQQLKMPEDFLAGEKYWVASIAQSLDSMEEEGSCLPEMVGEEVENRER
jgi:hypothetical protein